MYIVHALDLFCWCIKLKICIVPALYNVHCIILYLHWTCTAAAMKIVLNFTCPKHVLVLGHIPVLYLHCTLYCTLPSLLLNCNLYCSVPTLSVLLFCICTVCFAFTVLYLHCMFYYSVPALYVSLFCTCTGLCTVLYLHCTFYYSVPALYVSLFCTCTRLWTVLYLHCFYNVDGLDPEAALPSGSMRVCSVCWGERAAWGSRDDSGTSSCCTWR